VAHGGHCVARHEGQVVFVRHALPGERVRARVTEQTAKYLRADAVEGAPAVAAPGRAAPARSPGRAAAEAATSSMSTSPSSAD
jgi:tRNA/tmRNA/rRNA uracil-C5-methylase (TrmA/RlmC/RlmD family)